MKSRILEPEEEAITKQWPGKHAPTATDMYITKEEPQDVVCSTQSTLGLLGFLDFSIVRYSRD
jgi:hypothetical protein